MRANLVTGLTLAAVLLLAGPARAQVFLGAGVGAAVGDQLESNKFVYTGNVGYVSPTGWVGFEGDFGFIAQIRSNITSARTLTGSVLIGKPFQSRWRPYGSVGVGVMGAAQSAKHVIVPSSGLESMGVLTFGGGLMGDLADRFGVRADVRVIRGLKAQDHTTFTFNRFSAGAYVKF